MEGDAVRIYRVIKQQKVITCWWVWCDSSFMGITQGLKGKPGSIQRLNSRLRVIPRLYRGQQTGVSLGFSSAEQPRQVRGPGPHVVPGRSAHQSLHTCFDLCVLVIYLSAYLWFLSPVPICASPILSHENPNTFQTQDNCSFSTVPAIFHSVFPVISIQ